ncbi:hypothetical protein [Roseiconus lacunae]|uniref:hypothetical protein n=1 Tax=Roseiconus lacunae TaxID=2605694 RepID=UPI001E61723D|nr:hypothetical protein [Roseiconus lacunae]MCD0462271.1 hypothetical protein [Roseiconus lacunae]
MVPVDYFPALAWLAINSALAYAVWRCVNLLLRQDGVLLRIGVSAVFIWATIVSVAVVLGSFGELSPAAMSVGVIVFAIIWKIISAWIARPFDSPSFSQSENKEGARRYPGVIASCWLIWCIAMAIRILAFGLMRLPTNWDTLTYHLSSINHWLDASSLYAPYAVKWFFPTNNEILALWLVAPFSGDFLASLNNVCPLVIFLVGLFTLLRQLNVAPVIAHISTMAATTNYIVWHQVLDNKNDLPTYALFFMGLAFCVRAARRFRKADVVVVGVCFGLLAGIKYYALAYAAILGVSFCILLWANHGAIATMRGVVSCGLCGLVLSGYWYIRNAFVTGMPLYPKGVIGSSTASVGGNASLFRTTLIGNQNPERWEYWANALWQLTNPVFAIAVATLPIAVAYLLLHTRGSRRNRDSMGLPKASFPAIFLATAGAAFSYGITPFTVEFNEGTLGFIKVGYVTIRMGMIFLTMSIVIFSLALSTWWANLPDGNQASSKAQESTSSLTTPRQKLVLVCSAVFLLASQLLFEPQIRAPAFVVDFAIARYRVITTVSLVVISLIAILFYNRFERACTSSTVRWAMAIALLQISAFGCAVLAESWHWRFAGHYNWLMRTTVFSYIRENMPEGERVCVTGPRSYPFYGSRHEFKLIQAHQTPAQPSRFPSVKAFLEYILDNKVDTVVVHRERLLMFDSEQQLEWNQISKRLFDTYWKDSQYRLMKVDHDRLNNFLKQKAGP